MDVADPHVTISTVMSFIIGDLAEIALPKDRIPKISFPAFLICFSGMDFLGALISMKTKNKARVLAFLNEEMASIDGRYKYIAKDLYETLRTSLVHCGTMGGYFLVEADESYREKHLRVIDKYGRQYVVLHTASFVQHFLKAVEATQEQLRDKPEKDLSEMLRKILKKCPYKNPPESLEMYEEPHPLPASPFYNEMNPSPMQNTPNGTCATATPGPPYSVWEPS